MEDVQPTGKTVLIVEDNDLNLKLFCDILEAHGYATIEVRDGTMAVAKVAEHLPHLVIMDIQLPKVSGLDLIIELKAQKHLSHIPIIAVTAYAMRGDEEKILASGCEGYLSKPISIDSFIRTVSSYLNPEAASN